MKTLWLKLHSLLRRDALDRDFEEEAAAHLDLATDEFVRQGLPPHEARRRVRLQFGSAQAAKDAHRDARGLPWLESLAFDARLALRGVRRDWTYALASMAMLALALALNTTVFTVMDAMLFRGFPFVPRSHELVFLQEHDRLGRCCLAYADVASWQTEANAFQGIAPVGGEQIALRDAEGHVMDLRATTVGTNVFGLLGVTPALGRDFSAADGAPGAPPTVLLSHRLWQARFGGRPEVVGARVWVDGAAAQIIGVMPQAFEFPLAASDGLWIPIVATTGLQPRGLTPGGFTAVARLREGVPLAQARAELEAINRRLETAHPDTNRGLVPTAVDHAQFTSGADATIIWGSIWAAAWAVLLIACASVANLTLIRTIGRWHQFMTCLLLGGGRARLVRQLLLESALIAVAATLCAWGLIRWSIARWADLAHSRYQMVDYSVTSGTVAYLAVVGTVAALLVAAAPIARLRQMGDDRAPSLDGRGTTHGRRTRRLVSVLVSGQMALAVVLLVAAGVLWRSFSNIVNAETGARSPESVLVGFLRLPSERYSSSQARLTFLDRVQATLTAAAGIRQMSWSGGLPVKFSGGVREVDVEPHEGVGSQDPQLLAVTTTTPDYFDVVGARVVDGRDFTVADHDTAPPVAIVNERFASMHWPGDSGVGKRLRIEGRDGHRVWRVVVGVVTNLMGSEPLRQQFQPLVYLPMRQEPPARGAFFLARTNGPAHRMAGAVQAELQALDADVGLEYFDTLENTFAFDRDFMDADHSELGKYSTAAPVFAVVALLLATTGLFAVILHSVTQRTREIGVRMALGATPRHIRRLVFEECLRPVVLGVLAGLALALGVTRVIQSQLVGVSPSDPQVMVGTSVVVVMTALVACRLPIRRALRVAPAVALRHH